MRFSCLFGYWASIGYGMSAKENPVAVMGWQEVEGIVRSMVEHGSYMGANEVFSLWGSEDRTDEIAVQLVSGTAISYPHGMFHTTPLPERTLCDISMLWDILAWM